MLYFRAVRHYSLAAAGKFRRITSVPADPAKSVTALASAALTDHNGTMLKLSTWRTAVDTQQASKFWDAVRAVPDEYTRVLTASRKAMATFLGLDSSGEGARPPDRFGRASSITRAEMFTRGGITYILALHSHRESSRPWAAMFGEYEEDLDQRKKAPGEIFLYVLSGTREVPDVTDFIECSKRALGVDLKKWDYPTKQFSELKQEGRQEALKITAERVSAARLLSEKEPRLVATAIKSALGGLILSDVERQLKRDKVRDVYSVLTKLQGCGLITTEYVMVCTKNQQQVARFADADVIEELSRRGVRCGCGRKIEEERMEEAAAITDVGRELLDKSTWMSVILTEELRGLGISDDRIMIEYSSGGDEMDCIADVNGEVVLFELKDKEFSLREAYSFGAKIGLVRPRHPVIVTTERVGGDAKEHFQKAELIGKRSKARDPDDAMPIRFIEGLENLSKGLENLASSVHRGDAFRVLREVMPMAAISPHHLLDSISPAAES